ncbi:auxilin-like protein 1 isoform X4 [Populus trichocarpa]|uniref:auxilin-like protein 1 isoform X3 n=1 Tax=Populus trichocarpa TaxID=3694 RepID=UPI0022786291|nr:auxilin-like protein 1 isoform X3 [Populus trichocarpa]XP_052309216.1 auxilin-like protein 1 isoform X4 [Populus trichocarpa]
MLSNGRGHGGKHVYDGVFGGGGGGAVKPGSRVEDYREIFGGFGATGSSIPILDVPELNENGNVSSVGAQRIDYAKIFGGFGDADFGLPLEEFLAKPKKVKSSINGTRSPAEAGSRNAGSKHSNVSKDQKGSSPEPSFQRFGGVKQFNVSYNKSNPGNKNGTNGMTHVAQLHAVPGYTFLVDEVTPSKMAEGGKPARSALDDACLNVNGSKSVKEDAARRKAVSGPQPSIDTHTFRSLAEFQKKSSRPRSMSNDMPFDAFEIGLGRHPPSSSPSNSSYNNGGENTSMNSKFGVSRNDASRDALGDYSPAFSDEEIDANSDAAASVAALRKAIEEAQMKIKIAKELMERKKEGLQNRAKTSFNNGWKAQKSGVKTAERSKRSNELGDQEMHEKEDTPKQVITGLPEHNVTKASQLPQSFEDEKKSSFANNVVRKTHSMESKSTRTDSRLEEAEDWESTEEFFEAADYEEHREMPSEYEEAGNAEKMVSYDHENKWREKMTAEEKIKMPERGEETFKEHKVERELSSEEFFEAADYEEHREMPSEYEEAGNAEKMVSYDHENKWREKMTAEEKIKTPECGEETFKEYKVERELNSVVGAFQWNLYANFVKPAGELHNQEENEEKMRISNNHEEAEQTSIVSDDWEDCETKLEKLHHPYKKAEFPIREFEENGEMKELKDAQDSVETEKKQREALDHKEMENRSDEVPITDDEYDGSLDDIYEKEANVEGQQEDWDRVECGMKQGGWNLKENEEKQNDLHRGEISGEDGGIEGSAKLEELKEDEEILKRSDQMNEIEKRGEKMCEGIETERIRSESHQGGEDRKAMEVTEQSLRYEGGNLETAKDEQEKKNLGESDNAWGRTTNFAAGDLKTQVLTAEENGRLMEVTEFSPLLQGTEQESKAVKDANSPEEQDCEIACLAQGFIGLDRIKKQTADVTEDLLIGENGVYFGENDVNFENKQNHHVTEYKSMPNQEKCVEDVTIELDDNGDVDICEPEVHAINEESEKSSISSHNERWSSDETESLCDPECCIEEAACEFGENNNDINESEVTANHENSFESSHDDRWVDNGINTKASQQPCIFKGQGEITEKSVEEELSQSTSKKEENCCKNLAMEEKECEDDLRKEVEVEKKHLKKKEKMKEGEVEREKERIAVERAIREARERAFAEARERAAIERAAAEAHQRSKAEVRERLEKAPSEANNKSAAEKASSEAKLKAERAAVERATAEARQRALEKALSEKAAFEARNQAEKSTAERLSSISKANGMNSRDKQYNDPGPSSSSRYPGSSNHGESANGGNGESAAQRSKATLERHQRTAERAAKALAEKNMRDLLAQKEQAERNRLAETLDADVKRWSSGKERNLRALLSTLQYILCPDSGWQSIPLTELVSSTAVKKAYRKATLFVHPDKLQQRGASIQQKYICEKVFDLLKDAWNKLSAEER